MTLILSIIAALVLGYIIGYIDGGFRMIRYLEKKGLLPKDRKSWEDMV